MSCGIPLESTVEDMGRKGGRGTRADSLSEASDAPSQMLCANVKNTY